jgi:hypothetical protein
MFTTSRRFQRRLTCPSEESYEAYTAELVAASVRPVPGVVAVRSDLSWRVGDLARGTAAARLARRV